MSQTIPKGQSITLKATFVDVDGNVFDPSEVLFRYREPSGLEGVFTYPADVEVTRVSEGLFSMSFVIGVVGRWTFKAQSMGSPATASADVVVRCNASEF